MNKQSLISHLIEAIIFIALLAVVWGYYSNQLDISDQNIKAFKGRLEQTELKNNELLASRDSYIATINDLEDLLDISKKEVREIQRQLDSKVAYIARLEQEVRVEYIEVVKDSIIYVDNSPQKAIASFHYDNEWISLFGENEFTFGENFNYNTTIKSLTMDVPLRIGLTNDYQIFATTENPYVSFSNIDGAAIDGRLLKPKKKRFSWGLQLGFGIMYDVIDKDVAVGPYGGLGAEFNF